jgi:ectonucleotide pyrophosphatase/phosphodiesterase family protein 5
VKSISIFLFVGLTAFDLMAQQVFNVSHNKDNTVKEKSAPYVLLISLDGFRWDYLQKYKPEFLTKFVHKSARLKSLLPSFPTKTFPNHISIVTGTYPQNHGIVANRFYDKELNKEYSFKDPEAVLNPVFYLKKPLWVLAEEQGMRTASFFWPSSEAPIAGFTPTYFVNYDHGMSHQQRIDTLIQWYKLPAERRPHLTTLYFHDVDSAGHGFGQDSPELISAINKVDDSLRHLISELDKLDHRVNVVIVSDHGMAQYDKKNFEKLPEWVGKNYNIIGNGPIVHLYNKGQSSSNQASVKLLNNNSEHYICYQYQDTPPKFNINKSARIGDITCLADRGWGIGSNKYVKKGDHGWSQFASTDMDGIFYANGPGFKSDFELDSKENVNVMPLLTEFITKN